MASFTNDLRLKEIVTGDEDGTWGTSTNTNLSLIADAFSLGTKQMAANADESFTMPDATADGTRSLYLKITSAVSLTATRTVTLLPNTVSKVWIIENATTGSQIITIAQGSGATVNVPNGSKLMIVTDGAGAGAAVFNANATVSLASGVTGTLPVANGGTGATTLSANNVIIGNGTSAVNFVAPSTSGNVLTSNGTTWTSAGLPAGGLTFVVKTANYTTQDKEGVLADTTGGAFTVTLPATPAVGAQVVVADSGGVWGTNNLTIGRNGSLISNLAQDLVCDISGASVQFVYDGASWEVYAQVGGNGGTAVTLTGTQTLTNKTLTAVVLSGITSTASGNLRVDPATQILEVLGDGSSVVGQIQLNCHVNSHGQVVASQPHYEGATNVLTLPGGTTIGNANAVLVSNTGTQTLTNKILGDCTVDGTTAVGFRSIPQNSQSAAYTLVLADSGKHIFHPVADNNARTFTIPANSSVAYPIGTALTFINMAVANVTIAITTDTLTLSPAGTAGSRTLATNGSATCVKITATQWLISGSGLT